MRHLKNNNEIIIQSNYPRHNPTDRIVDFDIYAPPGGKLDLYAGWQILQQENTLNIAWTPRNEGHWIATRSDIIKEVLSDYDNFSSRTILTPKILGSDHNLIPTTIGPPQHRPYRQTLNESLAAIQIRRMETGIRDIAVELIEEWLKRIPHFQLADSAQISFTSGIVGVVDTLPLVWR